MHKKLQQFILFSAILFIFSCNEQKTENGALTFKGTVQNTATKEIYFMVRGGQDTVAIEENGSFIYQPKFSEPEFVSIHLGDRKNRVFLLADTLGTITVTIDAKTFPENVKVEGSENYNNLQELQNFHQETRTVFDTLSEWYNREFQMAGSNLEKIEPLRIKADSLYNHLVKTESDYIINFIEKNINSMIAMTALFQSFDGRNPIILHDESNMKYFDMVDSAMKANYPSSQKTLDFSMAVDRMKQGIAQSKIQNEQKAKQTLNIGDEAPNFTMPGVDGKPVSLKDFRGKYVLLDFWASWCKPCREENPNLVTVYKEFKSKNFEILQVSLDKQKEAWLKAIEDDKLSWKGHCSELLVWESPVVQQYGLQGIPANFLLNPDGKIMAMNLRGVMLYAQLKNFID